MTADVLNPAIWLRTFRNRALAVECYQIRTIGTHKKCKRTLKKLESKIC